MKSTGSIISLICLICCCATCGWSQTSESDRDDASGGIYLGVSYGYQLPLADMKDRFGNNFSVGGHLEFLRKSNFVFTLEGRFLFGNDVKGDVLGSLTQDNGSVITRIPSIAQMDIKERGWDAMLKVSYVWDLSEGASLSGIRMGLGVGYLQHRIRLKEKDNGVLYFNDPYIHGYDRLTSGVAANQFIGFQHFDQRGMLNVFAGVECIQGFTKDRRGYSYVNRGAVTDGRLDVLMGLRLGLQITIQSFSNAEDVWY